MDERAAKLEATCEKLQASNNKLKAKLTDMEGRNRRVKDLMSKQDLEKLVHAFIFSRLDYCNSVFTGLPKKSIRKLQPTYSRSEID